MNFDQLIGVVVGTCLLITMASCQNILEVMNGKGADEFKKLLSESTMAAHLLHGELSIFAPTDKALKDYKGLKDEHFVLNHIVNVAVQISDRAAYSNVTKVSSMLPGSPPLWISKNGAKYFVNGAEIIMRDIEVTLERLKRKQRLHFLDNVLEPLVPQVDSNSAAFVDLTAGKLLRDSEIYKLTEHSIRSFTAQVKEKKKFGHFDKPGTHTFFIPVDTAFAAKIVEGPGLGLNRFGPGIEVIIGSNYILMDNLNKELMDGDVITGHVVPDVLLFTKPISKTEQKTATYTDRTNSIKVTAVIQLHNDELQVKSNTVQGNRHHNREHVVAKIVKANIPVANGIVHLIDKPLIVVALPIWKFLEEEQKNGRLSKFAKYISDHGGSLRNLIEDSTGGATIFAPSNEAFDLIPKEDLEAALKNETTAARLLGLHFVTQRISADDVRITRPQNDFKMFGAKVAHPANTDDQLWFYYKSNNEILSIDGMGVTAEVIEPDIGATNGVIHVINRVLGFPAHTVAEKLALDPMTTSVNSLGAQNHFNRVLNKRDMKFTYLVPSDEAWTQLQQSSATVHKILFMGDFSYQTTSMLERHLRIGEALTTEDLVYRTNTEGGVNMVRGDPQLKFVKMNDPVEGSYIEVQWENIKARVIRPNLECVNGYIHIIDKVIMKRRDVTVSKATMTSTNNIALLVLTAVAGWIIRQ